MNYIALFVGIFTAYYVVVRFKKTRLEKTKWAYPLLLGSFPVYYFIFALYAQDYSALGYELVIGIFFIAAAYTAYRIKRKPALLLISVSCILHAAYDLFHNHLFINTGTPAWWIEFCGSIDLALGLYLLYFALSPLKQNIISSES